MIRLLSLLISLFIGVFSLGAQERSITDWDCQSSLSLEQGQEGLKKLEVVYSGMKGFRSTFLQESYLAALDTVESSKGDVLFLMPSKMRWKYSSPEPQDFVLNQSEVKMYQPSLNQGFVDNLNNVLISELPVSFLAGVGKLSAGFSLKKACRGPRGTNYFLTPLNDDSQGALNSLTLISSPAGELLGGKVVDSVGNYTAILLEARIGSAVPAESEFNFTFPAGTDVQDRRER